MEIQFGACGSLDSAPILAQAGYDYIELGLSSIARLSKTEFKSFKKDVKASPLKPEAFNLFVPSDVRLVGTERSLDAITDYLSTAVPRAAELGGKIIVFGSGGARRIPDGHNRGDALKELAEFCSMAGEEAEKCNITIAIEPLRKAECNAVNGTAQGLALASASGKKNVGVLIDFYHMYQDNEDPSCVLDAGSALTHTHIAHGITRAWPRDPAEVQYGPFFMNLDSIGYEGRMSVEGKSDDLAVDAPHALSVLNTILARINSGI